MDSLTKIITQIEQENQKACEQLLENARQKAGEIADEAKQKAARRTEQLLAEGKRQAAAELAKATSAAELAYKRELLAARVSMIDGVLQKALDTLCALPEQEYFDTLCELAVRYAEPGQAVMRLNDRDFARAPEGFAETVNDRLGGRCRIRLSGGAENISGGFLLCYEKTVINAGFEALLDDVRDDVKDTLNRTLFQ